MKSITKMRIEAHREKQMLEGVRVISLCHYLQGPAGAQYLADMGADVIKVEPIDLGDPMRYIGSTKGGISALFANCNRGKRSLRVDLKTDTGRDIVEELAAGADIVLTNFRPGVMDGLGLGSDHLRALNPRLIYAGVTGFGLDGPMRDAPAYDPIIRPRPVSPPCRARAATSRTSCER